MAAKPKTSVPPLLPAVRNIATPPSEMGAIAPANGPDINQAMQLLTSLGISPVPTATPQADESTFAQSDINNLQAQLQGQQGQQGPLYPIQTQLPPPILPPVRDPEHEKEQARRALQVAGLLPLLGQLTGNGNIGSQLFAPSLTAALTGIQNREIQAQQDDVNNYNLQRQNRADQIQAIDFKNDAERQQWADQFSVNKDQRDRIVDALREKRLLQTERDRQDKQDAADRIAQDKGRQAAISSIRKTASDFPNNPEMIQALHGQEIDRYGLNLGKDPTTGALTIDGTPVSAFAPASLVKSREQTAANTVRDTAKAGFAQSLEKLRQTGKLDLEDYKYINAASLADAVTNRQITVTQMHTLSAEKIAQGHDQARIDAANISSSARGIRQNGLAGLDPKTAITRFEQVQTRINALKKERLDVKKMTTPQTMKVFGEPKLVNPAPDNVKSGGERLKEIDSAIKGYESLQEIYLGGAGLKNVPDKNGNPRYMPKVGAGKSVSVTESSAGLKPVASRAKSEIEKTFGVEVGGYRKDAIDQNGHPAGLAVDAMVPKGSDKGQQIANWAVSNAGRLGVSYVMWNHRINTLDGRGWRPATERGDSTANHEDNVHINFKSGGSQQALAPGRTGNTPRRSSTADAGYQDWLSRKPAGIP